MATQPLLLIGAGGFSRETAAAVAAINAIEPRWDLLGFLDDDPQRHGTTVGGVPVLGPLEVVHEHPDAAVILGIGSPRNFAIRRKVVERLGLDAPRYGTIVHPAASIGSGSTIGAGTVILAGVVLTADATLGRHNAVMPQCVFTHDDDVGSFTTFGAGVRLAGGVVVEHETYIGSGAMVREGCTIGTGSLVGMGSLVLTDVPPHQVWAGSPARYLRPAPTGGPTLDTVDHDGSVPPNQGAAL